MALVQPLYVVDTTFTAKNIVAAASVYTFTAAASAKIQFLVKLTNAAGGGDYVVYLTHGWLGAGSPATMLPKTTATAAAGETIIEFQSMELSAIKNTDVVNVMIKGLAGDGSVNGAIRIVADNPSVFDPAADTVATVTTVTALGAQAKLDVNAEADTALTDIYLDHLLAADYDPAAKPGLATALLNELVGSDAGVSQFTANALELAPTGGVALTAQQVRDSMTLAPTPGAPTALSVDAHLDDILAEIMALATLDEMADAVHDEIMHVGAGTTDAAIADILDCTCGGGSIAFTYTVTNSATLAPIDGVYVWVTTDLAGTDIIWNGYTDAFGVARTLGGQLPMLDPGDYYFWKQHALLSDDDSPDLEHVS